MNIETATAAPFGQVQSVPGGLGFIGEIFQGVGPFKKRWYRKLPDGRSIRLARVPGPPTADEIAALERVRVDRPHDIVELENGALRLRRWKTSTDRGVVLLTIGKVDYYHDNARVRGVLRPAIQTETEAVSKDPTLEPSPEMSAAFTEGPPKSNAGDTVNAGATR